MYKISIDIKAGNKIAAQFQSKEIEGEEPALRFTDKWKAECQTIENMLSYIEKVFWYQKGTLLDILEGDNLKAYKAFQKKVTTTIPKIKSIQEFTIKIDCDGDVYKNTFKF